MPVESVATCTTIPGPMTSSRLTRDLDDDRSLIRTLKREDQCVILYGGVATELRQIAKSTSL
jgi:hypothetical protein